MLRKRLMATLVLVMVLLGLGTASGSLVGAASAETNQVPYKCFFITDGQGHVIYTVCVPWPI